MSLQRRASNLRTKCISICVCMHTYSLLICFLNVNVALIWIVLKENKVHILSCEAYESFSHWKNGGATYLYSYVCGVEWFSMDLLLSSSSLWKESFNFLYFPFFLLVFSFFKVITRSYIIKEEVHLMLIINRFTKYIDLHLVIFSARSSTCQEFGTTCGW